MKPQKPMPGGRKKQTKLMRVPIEFEETTKRIARKQNYRKTTDFLRYEGVKVFQNAEFVTDMLGGMFRERSRRKNKNSK